MSDKYQFLRQPGPDALEVYLKSYENHSGELPFDGRLIPNQWLLNERGLTEQLGEHIAELEATLKEKQE
jgi:hypothetical protein